VLWRFQAGPSVLSGLSLAVGVAVVRALQQLGFNEASLKWPNDIFVHQKKLGGILIEVSGEQSGPCHAVIGLGLNIALPSMTDLAIDQPYTDLVTEAGVQYLRARNSLIAAVLNQLGTLLENYEKEGLTPYIEEWRQLDAFKSQSVYIKNGEQKIEGVAQGITEDGFLQIIDLDGNLKTFASGEVSLRLRG
jgi:BirA family biotin operon repressor/biotin-[acetyl-CoA-carboxylase] ligase